MVLGDSSLETTYFIALGRLCWYYPLAQNEGAQALQRSEISGTTDSTVKAMLWQILTSTDLGSEMSVRPGEQAFAGVDLIEYTTSSAVLLLRNSSSTFVAYRTD